MSEEGSLNEGLNRALGLFVGSALGDALGTSCEMQAPGSQSRLFSVPSPSTPHLLILSRRDYFPSSSLAFLPSQS